MIDRWITPLSLDESATLAGPVADPVPDDTGNPECAACSPYHDLWKHRGPITTPVEVAVDEDAEWAAVARKTMRRWMDENPF
jgi:hypothetical protein